MKRPYQHYKVYTSKSFESIDIGIPTIRWFFYRRPKRNPKPCKTIIQVLRKGRYIRTDAFSIILSVLTDDAGRGYYT